MCNILQVAKKDYHISLYKKYGIGIDFDLYKIDHYDYFWKTTNLFALTMHDSLITLN